MTAEYLSGTAQRRKRKKKTSAEYICSTSLSWRERPEKSLKVPHKARWGRKEEKYTHTQKKAHL